LAGAAFRGFYAQAPATWSRDPPDTPNRPRPFCGPCTANQYGAGDGYAGQFAVGHRGMSVTASTRPARSKNATVSGKPTPLAVNADVDARG
jgi:hypothetical protein